MSCRLCFCCSPRAAARFVGILDLILGFLGILFSSVLLEFGYSSANPENNGTAGFNQTSTTIGTVLRTATADMPDNDKILWVMAVGLIFPAVLTLIVGITLLISVSKNNICIARLAYVLNVFLIVGAFAVFAVLFIMGYHWFDGSPVLLWALLQSVFLCAVHEFVKSDLGLETV